MSLPTELLEKAVKATETHGSTILHGHALDLAREVIQLRAEVGGLMLDRMIAVNALKDASRERDEARKEAAELREQLAALTDPSPEAQLRRYREAEALVENPPKVAYWDHSREPAIVLMGAGGGSVIGLCLPKRDERWKLAPMAGDEVVVESKAEAVKACEAYAVSRGWQLCGGAP